MQTVPIEDIGYIIIDHPQISLGHALMQRLAEANVAVVFCDAKHHPASMLLHLDTHYIQTERFRWQLAAGIPLKKQLWQQTIKAKLANQARLLDKLGLNPTPIQRWAKEVLSGDTSNREALASRYYWGQLFGNGFTRDRYGDPPNNLLNYGYAILRAAVSRALAGSGLLPTLGIHHRNKYNAFCLADDIMEPYRPFVDEVVCQIDEEQPDFESINMEHKQMFLGLLTHDSVMGKQTSPLMISISKSAAGLAGCFEGKQKKLPYPLLPLPLK